MPTTECTEQWHTVSIQRHTQTYYNTYMHTQTLRLTCHFQCVAASGQQSPAFSFLPVPAPHCWLPSAHQLPMQDDIDYKSLGWLHLHSIYCYASWNFYIWAFSAVMLLQQQQNALEHNSNSSTVVHKSSDTLIHTSISALAISNIRCTSEYTFKVVWVKEKSNKWQQEKKVRTSMLA